MWHINGTAQYHELKLQLQIQLIAPHGQLVLQNKYKIGDLHEEHYYWKSVSIIQHFKTHFINRI